MDTEGKRRGDALAAIQEEGDALAAIQEEGGRSGRYPRGGGTLWQLSKRRSTVVN